MHGSDLCSVHLGRTSKPSTLTSEVAEELVTAILAGNYLAVACRAVGVSRSTLSVWMQRGRSSAPVDAPYRELRDRIERARAQAEARHVAIVTRAAIDGNWQASAWMLEREFPDRWGRVSVRVRDDAPPPVEIEQPDEDDPFAEVDELAARRAVARAG